MERFNCTNGTETLYRVIKRSYPNTVKIKNGKILGVSSALFKDANGVSVDLKMERSDSDVKKDLIDSFKVRLMGFVSLSEKDVKNANALLHPCPTKENRYHAEIHKNCNEILLDEEQALQLADNCTIEFFDYTKQWTNSIK